MNFTIDYDQAIVSVEKIEAARENVKRNFDNMKTEVSEKVGGNSTIWSGRRADAFKNKWDDFSSNFDACLNQLATVREKVEAAHKTYAQLDQ